MPGYAYLDSSALVKLIVVEIETAALENYAAHREGLLSSRLAATEVLRAARRAGQRRIVATAEQVMEAIVLLDVTRVILTRAAGLPPNDLRTLDAIHLATALNLELPEMDFVTYDRRLAEAAKAAGLVVSQPGLQNTSPPAS